MIKPLGDKVVVKPSEEEEKTSGGIILPDTAKKKPQEGEVIAIGPGRVLDDGSRAKMSVKVGQIVVFAKYGGTEVKLDGQEYVILVNPGEQPLPVPASLLRKARPAALAPTALSAPPGQMLPRYGVAVLQIQER